MIPSAAEASPPPACLGMKGTKGARRRATTVSQKYRARPSVIPLSRCRRARARAPSPAHPSETMTSHPQPSSVTSRHNATYTYCLTAVDRSASYDATLFHDATSLHFTYWAIETADIVRSGCYPDNKCGCPMWPSKMSGVEQVIEPLHGVPNDTSQGNMASSSSRPDKLKGTPPAARWRCRSTLA